MSPLLPLAEKGPGDEVALPSGHRAMSPCHHKKGDANAAAIATCYIFIAMRAFILFLLLIVPAVTRAQLPGCPNLRVEIKSDKAIYQQSQEVRLTFLWTNDMDAVQQAWIDHPALCSGGPANTSVQIINLSTGMPVLRFPDISVTCPQAFTPDKVMSGMYHLQPRQSMAREYALTNLCMLNNDSNSLPPGNYLMQVTWCGNVSNWVRFKVEGTE